MIGWGAWKVGLFGAFSFFATLAVYNGQRLFKVSEVETPWLMWVRGNSGYIRMLTILASVVALVLSLVLVNGRDFWYITFWMSPAVVVSFLYVFRLKGKNLRDVPYLKIHLIAFAWVFVLILFPFFTRFYLTIDFVKPFIALILGHYFYVVAITIPFDIRDLKYDIESQKTIPQVLGVNASRLIAVGLLLVAAIFLTGLTPIRTDNYWFYAAIAVQIVLVMAMDTKRSDLYCAGWIDGAVALLGIAYFFN